MLKLLLLYVEENVIKRRNYIIALRLNCKGLHLLALTYFSMERRKMQVVFSFAFCVIFVNNRKFGRYIPKITSFGSDYIKDAVTSFGAFIRKKGISSMGYLNGYKERRISS